MKKQRSNRPWIERHLHDPYVKAATQAGYRSRAAYKLLEIDQKDQLFRPGMRVVDLGAAPGAWSQVAAARIAPTGVVFAVDLLPMAPLAGVEVLQGDFTAAETLVELTRRLGAQPVDLVLSDMAPNLSGIAVTDAARAFALAEAALSFAHTYLTAEGAFLVKVFQGPGIDDFRRLLADHFQTVVVRKPKASRSESRELYYLARRPKRLGKAEGA